MPLVQNGEMVQAPLEDAAGALLSGLTSAVDITGPIYYDYRQVIVGEADGDMRVQRASLLGGDAIDFTQPNPDATAYYDTVGGPYYADYSLVLYGVADADGGIVLASLFGGGQFSPSGGGTDLGVAFLGDSLTAGGYPAQWATLSGRLAMVQAIGGITSAEIAARAGAYGVEINVSGQQIVSGSNSITVAGGKGWTLPGDYLRSANPVYGRLGSVHGKLIWYGTPTFTPTTGETVPVGCPNGTPFIADYAWDQMTHVIWAGRNNYTDPTQVLSDVASIVSRLRHERFVVMSVINATGAGAEIGNPGWTPIFQIEQGLAEAYPRNFLNIRRLLIDRGLAVAGLTATAQDLADIANDMIPTQLRPSGDEVHLTTAGYGAVAFFVHEFLTQKGW